MIEVSAQRKNKINLSDYDYVRDIENRLLLASLNEIELGVLEEIIYSSLTTSTSKLLKDLEIDKNTLLATLEKFSLTNLLKVDNEIVSIDKKTRNYFEFEYQRFEEDFKLDLVFINRLLQKAPIHILPVWFSLPRSSNNIFQSIITKYLHTPHIYMRYLEDIEHEDPLFSGIIQDIFNSENFEISSKEIQKKHSLSRNEYLEYMVFLEFNLVCFISYKKVGSNFQEFVTPFHEYKNYLLHLKNTKAKTISNTKKMIRKRKTDFGFVEDLTSVLTLTKKPLSKEDLKQKLTKELNEKDPDIIVSKTYLSSVINKLLQVNFLEKKDSALIRTSESESWLKKNLENRALYLYQHSLNLLDSDGEFSEKTILEAEKSISRVINNGWIYFDDFIKGLLASISEDHLVKLVPFKKGYKYSIPTYSSDEIDLMRKIIFERLFEAGLVAVGSLNGKDCFCVTKLGKTLFE